MFMLYSFCIHMALLNAQQLFYLTFFYKIYFQNILPSWNGLSNTFYIQDVPF